GAVGHDGSEDGLALPVGVLQGLVAGGELMFKDGFLAVAVATSGVGLGAGPQDGQPGFPGRGADLAQFVTDVWGRPGGLDWIGVAHVQGTVRKAAEVRGVGRAERPEGLIASRPRAAGGVRSSAPPSDQAGPANALGPGRDPWPP